MKTGSPTSPLVYDDSFSAWPQPEQTIQYYRASTVALTLDGYNNTGALGPDGTPDVLLPVNIDHELLSCLNQTIGSAVPLINRAGSTLSAPGIDIFGIFWFIWLLHYVV